MGQLAQALTAEQWAERWKLPVDEALELLATMPPGTVEELPDGSWRLLDTFTQDQLAGGLGALTLRDVDRRPNAETHSAFLHLRSERAAASKRATEVGALAEQRAVRLSPHRDERPKHVRPIATTLLPTHGTNQRAVTQAEARKRGAAARRKRS